MKELRPSATTGQQVKSAHTLIRRPRQLDRSAAAAPVDCAPLAHPLLDSRSRAADSSAALTITQFLTHNQRAPSSTVVGSPSPGVGAPTGNRVANRCLRDRRQPTRCAFLHTM